MLRPKFNLLVVLINHVESLQDMFVVDHRPEFN